jgi:exopolysaccharide production protein ExoY
MYRAASDDALSMEDAAAAGLAAAQQSAQTEAHAPLLVPMHNPLALAAKRAIDLLGVAVFIVGFLPLYVLVAVLVRRSSPGPAHYWQDRVGQGGRHFHFYKFRSMVVNGDEVLTSFLDSDPSAKSQWEEFQKLDDDPRITRFGRFIRRTSIDELPQLWNVLKGEMSLVGPRPCMPSQEKYYGRYWKTYCAMKPGLTGLWQVSGRNKLTYDQRVKLDVYYAREWSLWLDLKILFKTVRVVITGDGSK